MRILKDISTSVILAFIAPSFPLTKATPISKVLLEASSCKSYPPITLRSPTHQMMVFCAELEKGGGKNSAL